MQTEQLKNQSSDEVNHTKSRTLVYMKKELAAAPKGVRRVLSNLSVSKNG